MGGNGRSLSGERSGKAAAIGGRSCETGAVVPAANGGNKDGRNSAAQKHRHHRWRCGSLSDCDRWMVLHEIKTAGPTSGVRFKHTGSTSRGRLRKEHCRAAI